METMDILDQLVLPYAKSNNDSHLILLVNLIKENKSPNKQIEVRKYFFNINNVEFRKFSFQSIEIS